MSCIVRAITATKEVCVAAVKLSERNTRTMTCQVILPKGKKPKQYIAIARYESINEVISTVNNSGMITLKTKGTCYILVYAKIKITVK